MKWSFGEITASTHFCWPYLCGVRNEPLVPHRRRADQSAAARLHGVHCALGAGTFGIDGPDRALDFDLGDKGKHDGPRYLRHARTSDYQSIWRRLDWRDIPDEGGCDA